LAAVVVVSTQGAEGRLDPIAINRQGNGFCFRGSERAFVPWGFNYDHDQSGRLIEDYWDSEWSRIEEDFREMRSLGANVVRVHLQFGKFMKSKDEANIIELDRLSRLLALAESTGLYLDLTGLGCYHKRDVPDWYDRLDEPSRWAAQASFWSAVADRGARSSAVFCYDLMNEPVVPGGERPRGEWLGPDFAGKHFVQFVSLEPAGRSRADIAKHWIRRLKASIRDKDPQRLITVGLVDWSLNRPGLTSGFDPMVVAPELDFLAVHLYPERGKLDEALETLRLFAAAGKPVVIEETFSLKCGIAEFGNFATRSREWARGWFGFYWGEPLEGLRQSKRLADALSREWLEWFVDKKPDFVPRAVEASP
jgi:hypothetical protein